MSFQKAVQPYQAPAVAGDFAAHNPNASMLAGEGELVSGTDGVTVGDLCKIPQNPLNSHQDI